MRGNRYLAGAAVAAVLALGVGAALAFPNTGPVAILASLSHSGSAHPRRADSAAGGTAATAGAAATARNATALPAAAGVMGALAIQAPAAQGGSAASGPSAASPAEYAVAAPAPGAVAGTGAGAGDLGDAVVRRVEQDALVTVRVKNVTSAFNEATALDTAAGGYVQSSSLDTGGGPAAANLVLAVPQPDLSSFLQQMGTLGTVLSTQVTGQDVTSQYVDLQGSLQALQAERQSYLTLLGKATAIGDILQIQDQITGVETQIEDIQGQINEIDDLSAMAQVTITLEPPPAAPAPRPAPAPTPLQRMATALGASVHALASGATDLALAVAWILPWAALGAGGYAVYRRVTRARA